MRAANQLSKQHKVGNNKFTLKMDKQAKKFLMFLLRFFILFVLFELCYTNAYCSEHFFSHITKMFAYLGTKVLNIMGLNASCVGDQISTDEFTIGIKQGCDSMEALAIFLSGVLAFPSSISMKLKGIIFGTAIIFFFNLLRVVSLFWIGLHYPGLFDLFHVEIWQILFIVLALGMWHIWKTKAYPTN